MAAKAKTPKTQARATKAKTPPKSGPRTAQIKVTTPSYSAKGNSKESGAEFTIDRTKFDVYIVQHTQDMQQHGENDLQKAIRAGWHPVPEMSDTTIGKTYLIREKSVTKQKLAKVRELSMRMFKKTASAGVGINRAGVSVRSNETELIGVHNFDGSNKVDALGTDFEDND